MTEKLEYVTYILPAAESALTPYINLLTLTTSIASVIIAILAFRITKKQNREYEEHNRLMTKPSLNDSTFIDNEQSTYAFSITNKGLGPAIIKEAAIYIDGEIVVDDDPLEKAINIIIKGKSVLGFGHETVAIESYISPGEKIDIATIKTAPDYSPEALKTTISESAHIIIRYESIYGESFSYDSRI
ncbi:hypothetical protein [Pseudomonas sp. EL_65y_Pfl1_R32]|uniref:hypothetical protein n=1 Tax=Pseudomonas sp. EL_65y_Pfl1_R32 TaxID=3088696 RepID=UPI0030D8D495